MHEHLQFHVRALLADFFDFIQRQLPREDDPRQPQRLPELDRGIVDRIGLHRKVHGHFRPLLTHHHDQAGVCHDQGIRLHRDHRLHVRQVSLHFRVVRHQI